MISGKKSEALFGSYVVEEFWDEMMAEDNVPREHYALLARRMEELGLPELRRRQESAENTFMTLGITFSVYQDGQGIDRIFPFDLVPRIIDGEEWETLDQGLQQRVRALNHFIEDVYHKGLIFKDGILPEELVRSCPGYLPECRGLNPPKKIWSHISGIDLIKHTDGKYYVLEDNLRVPSGVSYVLGNREIMKRTLPQVFDNMKIRPVSDYPIKLLQILQYLSASEDATVAVLTPGVYNSAYFEHSFLAQQMGVQLVEGRDLAVRGDYLCMRTTKGYEKVDVLYRRVDDRFLDPQRFNKESLLGVPGLFDVYLKGNIALANAPGTGVADDKAVYAYVPDMIRYYLGEEMKLPNVPTYPCWREEDRKYVLEHIDELVIKETNQAGGYGMLIGPHAAKEELAEFKTRILERPRDYIGQQTMSLSRVPTLMETGLEGRHVDLRPYVLYGENISVVPGGLTRVALKKGSLVVNSSQGGGSKDTWVLRREAEKGGS